MSQVLIIGGGPAGAVAAILLGRAGFDVTLVEQHRFPRDKVCGECLSALGAEVLGRLGLFGAFSKECEPIALRRTLAYAHDGRRVEIRLRTPMWGVSRASLDPFLLNEAARTAQLLQPMRCEQICPSGRSPSVSLRDLSTNAVQVRTAGLVLLADGRSALSNPRPTPTDDLGIKSHWRGIDAPDDAIELFGVAGHYGGIAPVGGGVFNVSFSVPAQRVAQFRGDVDSLFAAMTRENAELARKVSAARRIGPWLASPLPRFPVQPRWQAGVVPLGNAAAAIEPIGGEGMGLAMRSAELAAREIIAARQAHRPVDTLALRREFSRLWRRRRTACRLSAQVISRPALANHAIDFLSAAPQFARLALGLIGK